MTQGERPPSGIRAVGVEEREVVDLVVVRACCCCCCVLLVLVPDISSVMRRNIPDSRRIPKNVRLGASDCGPSFATPCNGLLPTLTSSLLRFELLFKLLLVVTVLYTRDGRMV